MNLIKTKKIPIIGAGPSGLFAALRLKSAGFNPVIYEARSSVGMRFHGDFQGLENWSTSWDPVEFLKENGISITFRCVPIFGGTFFAPDYIPRSITTKKPFFYLIRRGAVSDSLDYSLLQQVYDRQIPVYFNKRIETFPEGAIVSHGPRNFNMIAKGFTFETDFPNTTIGLVDDDLAPKGYAYLLIHEGIATFSTVVYRDFKNITYYVDKTWQVIQNLTKITDVRHAKEFGGFGNSRLKRKPFPETYFPVGEAAGYQDFLFGFGIKYALLSAYTATEAIIHGGSYEKTAQQTIDPIHKVSIVNRFLFEKLSNKGYSWVMKKVERSRDPLRRLNQQYQFNTIKRLLYPLAADELQNNLDLERLS